MNIVWISANLLGYELLKETLKLEGVSVNAVITLNNHSGVVMYDGVKREKWDRLGINVYPIKDINQEKDLLKKLSPNLVIVCGWRQVIDQDILKMPSNGAIGFHPTCLPYGRGPAPIINSLLNGLKETGLTMFYLNEEIDGGDIIAQSRFKIKETDHAHDISSSGCAATTRTFIYITSFHCKM